MVTGVWHWKYTLITLKTLQLGITLTNNMKSDLIFVIFVVTFKCEVYTQLKQEIFLTSETCRHVSCYRAV